MINKPALHKFILLTALTSAPLHKPSAVEITMNANEAFNHIYTTSETLSQLSDECSIAIKVNVESSRPKCKPWLNYLKSKDVARMMIIIKDTAMQKYIETTMVNQYPIKVMRFTQNLTNAADNQRFIESYLKAYTEGR